MRLRPRVVLALLLLAAVVPACSSGDDGSVGGTTVTTAETPSTTTSEVPMDPRSQLVARLGAELGDPEGAARVVGAMDDGAVQAAVELADGDVAGSPWLAYRPSTVADDEVDSLWVFSYGFRAADGSTPDITPGASVPPMDALVPGPTNEALARAAADFVAEHPVPIVAQWEVAQVLEQMGVDDVIAVDPDLAPDGSVTYLSTKGVADKGSGLLAASGRDPGHAGVLCFRDHAVRCLLTARASGLTADVPEGVDLPDEYDERSAQTWTRSLDAWIPLDLAGRAVLKG